MSRAYSDDLRERVLMAAERFGIGAATAVRWVRRWRDTGQRGARRQGYPARSVLDPHEEFRLSLVEGASDITLDEMADRLRAEGGISVSWVTVWRFFDRRGWPFKKSRATRRSRSGRTCTPPGSAGSTASRTSIRSG
ncbi:MAG: hypothetical protein AAFU49_08310 [Pseudomonadota bacterium]